MTTNEPPQIRVGHGHDIHALHAGQPLWLGGVLVPDAAAGFDTHSDGDVLSHAVIDALAGALADGDLGTHFPENDPATQDARSVDFVRVIMEQVRRSGYDLMNLDSFVTLGTTRLRPYVDEMAGALAATLGVSRSVVSVKARSHDGLGLEGRGEAASATATVLLGRVV